MHLGSQQEVAMLCGTVALAPRSSALTFSLTIVVLSLVITLVLQAVLGSIWKSSGVAAPMVLAQTVGIAVAVLAARRFWPLQAVRLLSPPPALGLAFAAGALLQFPLSALGEFLQGYFPLPEEQLRLLQDLVYPEDAVAALAAALGIGIVVPLCEEWLYRHTVLRRLRVRFEEWPAVFTSAFIFGLAHFAPHAVVAATLAGLVLGWLYLRVGLRSAIAFHMGVNMVPFIARPEWLPIKGFNLSDDPQSMPTYLWVSGLLGSMALLFFISRTYASGPAEVREPA